MTPTRSDRSGTGDGRRVGDDEFRVERRLIQGRETLVQRHPDRVYVERRAAQPVYFGIRVGDRLKDADADVSSPRITEWTVTEITPDRLVGEHVGTGERREFERERVERGLVVGNYATDLSEFARVAVHAVGNPETAGPDADDGSHRGRPYVTVVAYGNNGRKYGLRYRYVDPDGGTVARWEEDPLVAALDPDLRERLFETVEAALAAEEYVVEPSGR
jgi:hypothetical protein